MRRTLTPLLAIGLVLGLLVGLAWQSPAQKTERPPHGQDFVPGPALSPADAIKRMKVPAGFSVELVAAEPTIVNPVAMTFDERGRIWITESLEYPRRSAGVGRDRIKVLESTRGDGKYDRVTVFAEGLNIPSGIAVGHGGVWVANSPDILFYKIGPDGKAAGKPKVVVTGFGRTDTHELPNSLTWGPDGWLYGLNGVFNHSHVEHKGKVYDFTCAMFRIHPRTRDFELFCEGTSNPWGIAFDSEGSAFVSACVIDHLWHLAQTGYYIRQGGPYPPCTWPIGSIVKHRHQKAAYCGLHYFDSDAYPAEYRGKLYMGNIHGNCINSDELTRDGSTYFAKPRPDFLSANDPWFMPVSMKTGPDGCLYVLDWYDRYHCYQDANRDPAGIDRLRGRLYRVVYKDYRPAGKFDLGKETNAQLLERLDSPNIYFRDMAQRILGERPAGRADKEDARQEADRINANVRLVEMVDGSRAGTSRRARMHALWAATARGLVGQGEIGASLWSSLLHDADPTVRAWAVRLGAEKRLTLSDEEARRLIDDPSPDVRLQMAIAARRLEGVDPLPILLGVLKNSGEDKLIPHIVWQNLHPLLQDHAEQFLDALAPINLGKHPAVANLMPRVVERLLDRRKKEPGQIVRLFGMLQKSPATHPAARQVLALLAARVQNGEIQGETLNELRKQFAPILSRLLVEKPAGPLRLDAAMLTVSLGESAGRDIVGAALTAKDLPESERQRALDALVAAHDSSVLDAASGILADVKGQPLSLRGRVLEALGKLDEPRVASVVLNDYPEMEPDLRPRAIELLTQRGAWGRQLVRAVLDKKVPAGAVNVNQVRKLQGIKDAELARQVRAIWGTVREGRNPEREKVVADMRNFLRARRGDARKGAVVFKTLCAQCHKIYGEGQEVGPDLTSNGRASFDQLLSNVFDPSLVIGASYQATTVETKQGRTLTGLLVENGPQRVVLKTQGGKLEIVPRGEIEEVSVSTVSLMPEGIEKQLKPEEIADLFAFLTLDRPPGESGAKPIPGTPSGR
jgi:putative heme-binding domain-containing protein